MVASHEDCNPNHELPFKIKPDVIVYPKDSGRAGPTDSREAEITVEFKWLPRDDPFGQEYQERGVDGITRKSFVRDTPKSYHTLGQITGYCHEIFRTHYTFLFCL